MGKVWLIVGLAIGLGGCVAIPEPVRMLDADATSIELTHIPFFPQERYQCGPAALATLLSASAVDVTPQDLVPRVYIPDRKGSIQVEMVAVARTSQRIPYQLDNSLHAIYAELAAGRPVLVLQNLGIKRIPRWHYAVVVGIDTENEKVLLRSGTESRRETSIDLFLRTWARADYWALIALRPGELPAQLNRERYTAAIADLEALGLLEVAEVSWRTAIKQWPNDPVARFGLGNTLLQLDRPGDAEDVYRSLIQKTPGFIVARNNLAVALQRQARYKEAMAEIDQAIASNRDANLDHELQGTRASIHKAMRDAD